VHEFSANCRLCRVRQTGREMELTDSLVGSQNQTEWRNIMSKMTDYDCRQCGKALPLSVLMDGQKLICPECGQETNLLQALSRSLADLAGFQAGKSRLATGRRG
jgi:DNA-directed RNA polymerase subunit RPC12/RpoP